MKIRTGFVSNSSTASFIIRIKEDIILKDHGFMINEKDIPKLKKYGFKKSNLVSPFCEIKESFESKDSHDYISMKYFTSCNFEEVICFLVKNNIPFKASCHYDHKYVSYKKDSDYIFEGINYGIILDMYGEDTYESVHTDNLYPFKKIPKKEYLEMYDD